MTARKLISLMLRLIAAAAAMLLVILIMQDFLVFPMLWYYPRQWFTAPAEISGMTRHLVESADGNPIEVYEMRPAKDEKPFAAVLFHGNGRAAPGFAVFQRWLASLGIPSYTLEYRGYGHTPGWPSEDKIYRDGEAVWDFVAAREKRAPEEMIVFGQSLGTGFGAQLASRRQPRLLILISAYASLRLAGAETPLFGILAPFLRYRVPAARYIATLTGTCVISAHAWHDTLILFHHRAKLKMSYRGSCGFTEIVSSQAGHNDLFELTRQRLSAAVRGRLGIAPAADGSPGGAKRL